MLKSQKVLLTPIVIEVRCADGLEEKVHKKALDTIDGPAFREDLEAAIKAVLRKRLSTNFLRAKIVY